jgi:hypothetical protein
VAVYSTEEEALNKLRAFCEKLRQEVCDDFFIGNRRDFDAPATMDQFLYNCYALCSATAPRQDLILNALPQVYSKHFGHTFHPEAFTPIPPSGLKGLFKDFPHLYTVEKSPNGAPRLRTVLGKGMSFDAFLKLHKAVPDRHAKRRRVAENAGPELLNSVLRATHACLAQTCANGLPLPARELEKEFEKFWKIPLTLTFYGDVSAASFLRQFPKVFDVTFDGIQSVVLPKADPQFPDAVEDDEYDPTAEGAEEKPEKVEEKVDYLEKDDVDVVKGALLHLAGLFGSLSDAPAEKKRRVLPDLVKALSGGSKPDKKKVEFICQELMGAAGKGAGKGNKAPPGRW